MNRTVDTLEPLERQQPLSQPDFARRAVCLLGLPFDVIDIRGAVHRVRDAAFAGRRCFVSTPNLNFAMTARRDAAFRDSVLHSDLVLADGMPLVWLARASRLSLAERVSGADLFEALVAHPGPPVAVYLFGGPPGAAARAAERIERGSGTGVRCVGHDAPGYGSIEEMSQPDRLAAIDRSGAHFLVVALGAQKGQAWIERNAPKLSVPVLAHLGAVVNFSAGNVSRAPIWMRRSGVEWLWRIKEEPALWRRYARDGTAAIALLSSRVLPRALAASFDRHAAGEPSVDIEDTRNAWTLRLAGAWHDDALQPLRETFDRIAAQHDAALRLDLSAVTCAGNAFVALLLVALGWFGPRGGFSIVTASKAARSAMRRALADDTLLSASVKADA